MTHTEEREQELKARVETKYGRTQHLTKETAAAKLTELGADAQFQKMKYDPDQLKRLAYSGYEISLRRIAAEGQPVQGDENALKEIELLKKDEFFQKALRAEERAVRQPAIDRWTALFKAAYPSRPVEGAPDPEVAREADLDIKRGMFNKEFMTALWDKSDYRHQMAVDAWSEAHRRKFGAVPYQSNEGMTATGPNPMAPKIDLRYSEPVT